MGAYTQFHKQNGETWSLQDGNYAYDTTYISSIYVSQICYIFTNYVSLDWLLFYYAFMLPLTVSLHIDL